MERAAEVGAAAVHCVLEHLPGTAEHAVARDLKGMEGQEGQSTVGTAGQPAGGPGRPPAPPTALNRVSFDECASRALLPCCRLPQLLHGVH